MSTSVRIRRSLVALLVTGGLMTGSVVAATPAAADTMPSLTTALSIASKLVSSVNAERRYVGLPPLRVNSALNKAAHNHNLWMSRYNTMSHQLPPESSLGTRVAKCGYTGWTAVGENIAWNSDWSLLGAYYVERMMYNEVAPNDGHRLNIISRTYLDVGIDVLMDPTHHKMWITQDFGRR